MNESLPQHLVHSSQESSDVLSNVVLVGPGLDLGLYVSGLTHFLLVVLVEGLFVQGVFHVVWDIHIEELMVDLLLAGLSGPTHEVIKEVELPRLLAFLLGTLNFGVSSLVTISIGKLCLALLLPGILVVGSLVGLFVQRVPLGIGVCVFVGSAQDFQLDFVFVVDGQRGGVVFDVDPGNLVMDEVLETEVAMVVDQLVLEHHFLQMSHFAHLELLSVQHQHVQPLVYVVLVEVLDYQFAHFSNYIYPNRTN